MDWLEIIHLRSHSTKERNEAMTAFQNLLPPEGNAAAENIVLFQNRHIGNDLSIHIVWPSRGTDAAKSPLGLQLAAAFSEFGQINHSVWTLAANIQAPNGIANPEKGDGVRTQLSGVDGQLPGDKDDLL